MGPDRRTRIQYTTFYASKYSPFFPLIREKPRLRRPAARAGVFPPCVKPIPRGTSARGLRTVETRGRTAHKSC